MLMITAKMLTALNIIFTVKTISGLVLHSLLRKKPYAIKEPRSRANEPIDAISTLGFRESEKLNI